MNRAPAVQYSVICLFTAMRPKDGVGVMYFYINSHISATNGPILKILMSIFTKLRIETTQEGTL